MCYIRSVAYADERFERKREGKQTRGKHENKMPKLSTEDIKN